MTIDVGQSSNWKDVAASSVGVSSAWKDVASMHVGVGGAWKEFFSAVGVSYTGDSLDVSSQGSLPGEIRFNSTGTRLLVLLVQEDAVFQYNLSTAFDLSSASYSGNSLDISSEIADPLGMAVSPDGLNLFVSQSATIYQYSMSTGFDLSSASYASKSYASGAEVRSMSFNPGGTKLLAASGGSGARIRSHTLSSGFDVSTASYDSEQFDPTGQEGNLFGIYATSDGEKLFLVGNSSDTVYQYAFGTDFDVTTLSYSSRSYSVSSQTGVPNGLEFSDDGQKMFIGTGFGGSDRIYQYSVNPAFTMPS